MGPGDHDCERRERAEQLKAELAATCAALAAAQAGQAALNEQVAGPFGF